MQFDLLNGKLSINASDISTKEIIALINKSRLKASTWDQYISKITILIFTVNTQG